MNISPIYHCTCCRPIYALFLHLFKLKTNSEIKLNLKFTELGQKKYILNAEKKNPSNIRFNSLRLERCYRRGKLAKKGNNTSYTYCIQFIPHTTYIYQLYVAYQIDATADLSTSNPTPTEATKKGTQKKKIAPYVPILNALEGVRSGKHDN